MKSIKMAMILIFFISGPAFSETVTRDYQAVMHVSKSHAFPVLDRSDHVVGIGAFRGLAIFANGEVVVHRYEGWFDLSDGSGTFHGYASWRFEDGSEIRASYDGSALNPTATGVDVKARFHNFSGTGRFANASFEGAFEGRRLEAIEVGGSTYLKGRLEITAKK